MRKMLSCLLLLALLPLSSAIAQEPPLTGEVAGGWALTGVIPLADWNINAVDDAILTVLSPDASHLAWINIPSESICIADFAAFALDPICYPPQDDLLQLRSVSRLVWSPDSRYIAFVDSNLRYAVEGDVWVLDTTTGDIDNLTPDGVYGNMINPKGDGTMLIDLYPIWSPDGSLYFIRVVKGEDGYPIELYSFPRTIVAGIEIWGDLTLVADLTPSLGTSIPIFENAVAAFDGPLSFSPDGKWLAIASNAYSPDNLPIMGIFLVELATGEITHLVKLEDLFAEGALPNWAELGSGYMLTGVGWTSDGTRVLTTLYNANYSAVYLIQTYAIEVATGAVTPLHGWESISESSEVLETVRSDQPPLAYDLTIYTALLGNVVILRNNDPFGFSAIDLNNPSELPVRLTEYRGLEDYLPSRFPFSSVGFDGTNTYMLLDGYVLIFGQRTTGD